MNKQQIFNKQVEIDRMLSNKVFGKTTINNIQDLANKRGITLEQLNFIIMMINDLRAGYSGKKIIVSLSNLKKMLEKMINENKKSKKNVFNVQTKSFDGVDSDSPTYVYRAVQNFKKNGYIEGKNFVVNLIVGKNIIYSKTYTDVISLSRWWKTGSKKICRKVGAG